MAVWLCRAGRFGQHEARFFEDNRIYYTFEEIDMSISSFSSKRELQAYFLTVSPTVKDNAAKMYAAQGYAFCHEMKQGDWVITPSKTSPGLLHFAEISGDYIFDGSAEESYRHSRSVKWFAEMRRVQFEQDIQAAFGALMTICKIKQEDRIKNAVAQAQKGLNISKALPPPKHTFGIWKRSRLMKSPTLLSAITKDTASPVSLRLS